MTTFILGCGGFNRRFFHPLCDRLEQDYAPRVGIHAKIHPLPAVRQLQSQRNDLLAPSTDERVGKANGRALSTAGIKAEGKAAAISSACGTAMTNGKSGTPFSRARR